MAVVMEKQPFVVLLAEDSEHDIRAARRVWAKNEIRNPLRVVQDGEECLDYLLRRGAYESPESSPRPGVLLLDLNLPKVDGFEVLAQVRADPKLRRLPVVVLSTSDRAADINRCYDLGANAFLSKPFGMDNLSHCLAGFNSFWEMVGLPDEPGRADD